MRTHHGVAGLAASALLALGAPALAAEPDARFVEEAASGGMLEVQLGKYAAEHAADADVRAFGERMARDHGKANQELKTVAQGAGLTVPTQMSEDHRGQLEDLTKLRGADFDKAYMDAMVEDHEDDVDAFRAQAEEKKSAIDSWAAKTVPTLEAHLAEAKRVAEQVGARGETGGSGGDMPGVGAGPRGVEGGGAAGVRTGPNY
jgi:putative membrane protein